MVSTPIAGRRPIRVWCFEGAWRWYCSGTDACEGDFEMVPSGGVQAAWAAVEKHLAERHTEENRLHRLCAMPGWEYRTTTGPRKVWDDVEVPPEGGGWVSNAARGRAGWERFDYHEEAYWRRPKGEGQR